MKKTRLWILAVVLLLISGCSLSQQMWETVEDQLPEEAADCMAQAYTMAFDVPAEASAEESAARSGEQRYRQADGDYEIRAQTLLASDIDSVVRRLTGYEPGQLQLLRTRRFGLPEYQFVWYEQGQDGGSLCRAAVLMDDLYGYALTLSVKEGLTSSYEKTAQKLFSSFNIYYDEGI